jgi:hypothetical protein
MSAEQMDTFNAFVNGMIAMGCATAGLFTCVSGKKPMIVCL